MSAPSPDDPIGYDLLVDENDLDPTGRDASGEELALAAIVHRLTTDQIDLIDAPNGRVDFGKNVRLWCGEAITSDDAAAKGQLLDEILQRDDAIAKTQIDVSIAPPGTTFEDGGNVELTIAIIATLRTGAIINRVLGVNSVTVDFLSQGR